MQEGVPDEPIKSARGAGGSADLMLDPFRHQRGADTHNLIMSREAERLE